MLSLKPKKQVDILIVGRGPAGLSAAIYTARAGFSTVVVGLEPKIGGEDYDIDNYFGFEETMSSVELIAKGRKQAERFGAEVLEERVLGVYMGMEGGFEVKTEAEQFDAAAVILATGVSKVSPGIKNIADYEGKGVSYCVSCDGFFYRGKKVMVLGEGVYAANQALELTNYTPDVRICTQGKPLSITEDYLEKLKGANIEIYEKKIKTLAGDPALESVKYEDGSDEAVDGIFVAMGEASSTDFAAALGLETNKAFLVADEKQHTNIPGIYAAGDCVGNYLQIAVAVGEGAKAARAAIAHAKEQKAKAAAAPA
jgi:thioredoxin reductase (NADPH)